MSAIREFPGGLVVRILGFHCHGLGSIPSQGTEIPQAAWHGQKTMSAIVIITVGRKLIFDIQAPPQLFL